MSWKDEFENMVREEERAQEVRQAQEELEAQPAQGPQGAYAPLPSRNVPSSEWFAAGTPAPDQYGAGGRRAINPFQSAAMERKAEGMYNAQVAADRAPPVPTESQGPIPWQQQIVDLARALAPTDVSVGGVTYGDNRPVGGSVNPTQTYTPHTGFLERLDGSKEATGGGVAQAAPRQTVDDLIAARPDLRSSGRREVVQAEVGPARQPRQSIQNQMAQANALRAGGGQ